MKIKEFNMKRFEDDAYISIDELTTALLDGEIFTSGALNAILYHAGLFDEDVICTDVSCEDCPHDPSHSDSALECYELSSAYVREKVLNKVCVRTSVEDML